MKITSKKQFFSLWEQGLLGNRPPLFHTLQEALDSGLPKIGFRELGKAGGGAWELAYRASELTIDLTDARNKRWEFVKHFPYPHGCIEEVYQRWCHAGRRFIMDGSVPNDKSTMQGEVCRTEKGLESFLCVRSSRVRNGLPPMRETIAKGWHRHRGYLETRLLLQRYMDPSSRDDLDALLDLYPDASIEFTCFSVNTGVIPRRNTIFWEVRNY